MSKPSDPLELLQGEARERVERILNSAQRVERNPDAEMTRVPDETPQKAVARRLLSIAAFEKVLAAEKADLRKLALEHFLEAGDVATVRLADGTLLGKVRADKGTEAAWKVTDAGALRAWVEANAPGGIVEQVTTVVDPELVAELLGSVDADDLPGPPTTVNPATGEVVPIPPGIAYVPAGPPKMVTTPDKGAPDALRRHLGDQGRALLGITS